MGKEKIRWVFQALLVHIIYQLECFTKSRTCRENADKIRSRRKPMDTVCICNIPEYEFSTISCLLTKDGKWYVEIRASGKKIALYLLKRLRLKDHQSK